ncbi:hypothetical protein RIF29_20815 [Crotalaria pallida]|uniref:Uncharacterized protein n=1 Tax=Crotalaria pallida TaxID=3830 RepID=A0AAN9FAD5_CROPI
MYWNCTRDESCCYEVLRYALMSIGNVLLIYCSIILLAASYTFLKGNLTLYTHKNLDKSYTKNLDKILTLRQRIQDEYDVVERRVITGLYTIVSLFDDVWNVNLQSKATGVVVDFTVASSVYDNVLDKVGFEHQLQ